MDKKGNYSDNWSNDYTRSKITGQGVLNTTFTSDEIKSRDDFYQQLGYEYILEDILKYVNKPINKIKTLEVGCGGARNSVFLASKGMQVTCSDFSDEALRLAEDNFRKAGIQDYTLVNDDILCSEQPEDEYDVIMSFGLLEHFNDIDEPFKAMTKRLCSGGIHIHDIITKRVSIQTLSFVWNYWARIVKRLVKGPRSLRMFREQRRNFLHYENSYSLNTYVKAMEDTNVKFLYKGGYVFWTFFALPKSWQKILVRWAINHKSFFYNIDHGGYKWMEYWGPCWLLVGKKI